VTAAVPRTVLVVAAGVLVVAGVVAVRAMASPSALTSARRALDADGDFTRASDAGAALTRVSEHLERAAAACDDGATRCADLFTAAAFARVGAVRVLRCGRPEIFAFRTGMRSYLVALDRGEVATPPLAPAC
jgi:hypothetical protein